MPEAGRRGGPAQLQGEARAGSAFSRVSTNNRASTPVVCRVSASMPATGPSPTAITSRLAKMSSGTGAAG